MWFLINLIVLLAGCGDSANYLSGSISRTFPLGFGYVEIVDKDTQIAIRYQDDVKLDDLGSWGTNTVLEMMLPKQLELEVWQEVGQQIDLNRYVVMVVNNEVVQDTRPFPDVYDCQVYLTHLGAVNEKVAGRFRLRFRDSATMRGGFSAIMTDF